MTRISKAITCLYIGVVTATSTEIIFDGSKALISQYININFEEERDKITLTKVSTNDVKIDPDSLTNKVTYLYNNGKIFWEEYFEELNLTIPAFINNKPIYIEKEAFSDLQSNDLKLKMRFTTVRDGITSKYVQFPSDCSKMFYNSDMITGIDFSGADVSKITNAESMFGNCNSLERIIWRNHAISNITNMKSMFMNCWRIQNLNLSNFNTGSVTDMSCMFFDCRSLTKLNLKTFNTRNVTNMKGMFSECRLLQLVDLGSDFNTQNVIDMSDMFYDCCNLTNLDLSNFNTNKVANMENMFYHCRNLQYLTLSKNFNITKATNTKQIFGGCVNLSGLNSEVIIKRSENMTYDSPNFSLDSRLQ